MSRQGERGQRGDQGQHGQTGDVGNVGPAGATGAQGPAGRLSKSQLLVYLLILAVMLVGFYKFEEADQKSSEQREELCERQITSRLALRQVYRDVADLGLSIANSPTVTPERKAELITRFQEFERTRLEQLPEIEPGCPPEPQDDSDQPVMFGRW